MKLFLDMDGVLADFDKRAEEILGMPCYEYEWKYGTEMFWRHLHSDPNFFLSFDPMPDLDHLWDKVCHLFPTVLTALPNNEHRDAVREQKLEWISKYLGEWVPMITCDTKEKTRFCEIDDILVDDRNVNQRAWINAGGHFVHHYNAHDTVAELQDLGVIE